MGATTNVVLDDAALVPVAFTPILVSPAMTKWTNGTFSTVNSAITNPTIALGFSPASSQRTTDRVTISLAMPDPDTTEGQLSSASTGTKFVPIARMNVDVIVPDTFSSSNRADLYAFIKGWIASTECANAIINREPSW